MSAQTTPTKEEEQKPHAVCIPFPAQGHINPMLNLAKLLHSRGFHVTFVNTDYNHRRLLRSRGPAALDGLPSFRFESIPDGLPVGPNGDDVTQDIGALFYYTQHYCLVPFRKLLERLNETAAASGGGVPPVSCLVVDSGMFFALDAGEELGVPAVVLATSSAATFFCLTTLLEKLLQLGILPFKDESFMTNGQLDMALDWAPAGAKGIRLKDMPTFIRTTDSNDLILNFIISSMYKYKRALAIVFNTFYELEHEIFQFFSSTNDFPPLYPIGPLKLLLNHIKDEELKSIRANLWKDDSNCLNWLDSYGSSRSVLYVNFGSITVMTNDQLLEFAWGLADSNQPFLWIIRLDLVTGDSAVLPHEFLTETKDRCLITSWCDQERVLAHPAIGAFLTHNGWNSTMESIYNGVPMFCWPFFADQQTNCWCCCKQWGTGMEIDANVKRSEVKRQIRELMEGGGNEMKMKSIKWKELAEEATRPAVGSSYSNLENVIKVLLSQKQ